jgi:hypothetical protein
MCSDKRIILYVFVNESIKAVLKLRESGFEKKLHNFTINKLLESKVKNIAQSPF